MVDRIKLPFRETCEGYFTDGSGRILARDLGKGFIEFPGGGINLNETSKKAILRETFEETGGIIRGVREIKTISFKWDKYWAKTEKQKKRYLEFQGEKIHLFSGKVKELKKPSGDCEECGWSGEFFMDIPEVISRIQKYGWSEDLREYKESQLKFLKELV
jgi:8-oxo-dGTP pyrophosphatase MutT (NUDIX family)